MGFIVAKSHCVPTEFLLFNNSIKKKQTTWTTCLITKCWNLVYHLLTHHNSVLHKSQAVDSLSGLASLHNWIIAECALGSSSLHHVYSRHFSIRLETLLQWPLDQKNSVSLSSGLDVKQITPAPRTPFQQMLHCATRLACHPSKCRHISSLYLLVLRSRSRRHALLAWIVLYFTHADEFKMLYFHLLAFPHKKTTHYKT